MPILGSPFSRLVNDRNLSDREHVNAVRDSAAADFDATRMNMQLAESNSKELAVEVIKENVNEVRVHAGEFLRLLYELAHDEKKFYEQ